MNAPDPGRPARNPWPWRIGVVVVVVVAALVLWWVVRDDDAAQGSAPAASAPADTSTPADATPADATARGDAAGSAAGSAATSSAGCAATDGGTPPDAGTHAVADVDGDGERDTAWITPGADRRFGITTASGATFSVAIDSASPQRASAVVNVVATDDGSAPVALVDTGREVLLYSAAGCDLAATTNPDGDPYTFDKGFTGYGTGVGCTKDGDDLRLAGLNATSDEGSSFTVTRTFVELAAHATSAANGAERTIATGAAPDDPVVVTAQETSCGGLVAGEDGPVEPR